MSTKVPTNPHTDHRWTSDGPRGWHRLARSTPCGFGSTTTTTGRGSPIARPGRALRSSLLHSLGLSHREWEPVVAPLSARFRVVLPDLPLHGDSEDRPRHPYTPDWLAEVSPASAARPRGPRPLVAGHDLGAELALLAVTHRPPHAGAAGADAQPAAPPRRVRRPRARRGGGLPRGRAAGAGPRAGPRRQAGVPPVGRRAAVGAAQPGGARPRPPRVRRRRRQRQPRPLVGASSRAAGRSRPQRELLDAYPQMDDAGAAAVGRGGPGASAATAARRRSTCCPTAQLRMLPRRRVPDRLRRSRRRGARADRVLRLSWPRAAVSRTRPAPGR